MCHDKRTNKQVEAIRYFQYDTDISKDILFNINNHVEAAGFPVVAMVSDMGPSKVRLWKNLAVGPEKTIFTIPSCDDREVFVFTDAPHLLKLIRNNFIDSGFGMDGSHRHTYVDSACVREIIKRSVKDLKIAYRLR